MRIWDARRLIIPFSRFLSEPFENWTHTSPELLGVVKLYCGHNVPLKKLRAKFKSVLKESDQWDERSSNVLVTACTPDHVVVRLTMSARDSDMAWELRCHVREVMLTWLASEHPATLPRQRIEVRDKIEADGAAKNSEPDDGDVKGSAMAPISALENASEHRQQLLEHEAEAMEDAHA